MLNIKDIIKQIIDEDIADNSSDILVNASEIITPLTKFEKLNNLHKKYQNCQNCILYKTRKNVVFGNGSPNAKIFFIAESPWKKEDETAKSFLGEKGELFSKILEAIKLKREDVYFTDIIKCHPIEHDGTRRTPYKYEILSCKTILDKQLEIIKPKIIVAFGNTASSAILNTNEEVPKLRDNEYTYKNIKVIPTFHPAYLLRDTYAKKLAWEDFKKIRDLLK